MNVDGAAKGAVGDEAIATDETAQRRAQDALVAIARGTSGATGVALFRAIATLLAESTGAEHAFVGELLPGGQRVRTLAFCAEGVLAPDLEYDLADTPCAHVVGRSVCVHPAGVQSLFPQDHLLAEMGIESYVGIPVRASSGEPLGILVAMSKRPLPSGGPLGRLAEVGAEVMAARAGAELESLRAGRELARINHSLERAVVERTRELEAFASSISHDLRAPLRHISGFVELLQARTAAKLDEKEQHYLSVIAGAAARMDRMIDALLELSRTGRASLRRTEVPLEELVRRTREELEQANPGRAIEWVIGPLPTLSVDRPLFGQVVANLLDNAVKYTRGRAPARIEVRAEEDAAEQRLIVRDNGAGFDPRFAAKLFGVFERLHREDEFEGTGVGLANVRRIVERHGGTVRGEGEVDRGATFVVALPRVPADRR